MYNAKCDRKTSIGLEHSRVQVRVADKEQPGREQHSGNGIRLDKSWKEGKGLALDKTKYKSLVNVLCGTWEQRERMMKT
jgi:hypothetical protein